MLFSNPISKFFLLLTVCLFFIANSVAAKDVSLNWDPSPSSNVAGYKIYYDAGSSSLPLDGSGANEGSSPINVGAALSSDITGLPDAETHYFAVTAYDASGIESTYSNIVTSFAVVVDTNYAPVLAAISDKSVTAGASLNFSLSASDSDGDSLNYSATGLPSGASFNEATGTFSWTPGNTQTGSYNLTFSVSDGNLSDVKAVSINVLKSVQPAVGSKTVVLSWDPSPSNNIAGYKIYYKAGSSSLPLDGSGANEGVSPINVGKLLSSSITGLPDTETHYFYVTAYDSFGNESTASNIVTSSAVVEFINQAPVLARIGDKSVNAGDSLNFSLSASDPDDDSLNYSATELPSGASLNASTGAFSWTPNNTQTGNYDLTFSVSDGSLKDTETVAISIIGTTKLNGLRLVDSENGLPGVERADGGDDSNNHVNGNPKGDLDYTFRVVLQDTSGAESQNVILHLNGYAYQMSRESGDINSGATYAFTTRLGPAASQSFHFETRDNSGNISTRFPAESELQGPKVELMNGKNIVGIPGNITPEFLNSTEALGTSFAYRWIPSKKRNGSYQQIDNGGPVKSGEGYVIKRTEGTVLPSMAQFGEILEATSEIPVKAGWNLVANPYNGNVSLYEILVKSGNSEPLSWAQAASSKLMVDGISYYAGKDWGNQNILESSDGEKDAVMIPRVGYWIYVNPTSETVALIVPKPQQ
jgi:hypothetical protein